MTEYLTPPELHQLTGYARATSQASWLKERGVAHRLDGRRVIASRVHVQAWLEGRSIVSSGLNLAAVR
jgi:hypothetical protein